MLPCVPVHHVMLPCVTLPGPDGRGGAGPMSPTRESVAMGDEDEEEEEDEFGGQETLVTPRSGKAESEFSQQDTLVIREDQAGVRRERGRICVCMC